MPENPESLSELYSRNQHVFDPVFQAIMVKLFAGFQGSKFDILECNDDYIEMDGNS